MTNDSNGPGIGSVGNLTQVMVSSSFAHAAHSEQDEQASKQGYNNKKNGLYKIYTFHTT